MCSLDDERPQRPQHPHRHKQPPTNERVATYSVVTELSPVKVPLAIDVIKLLSKRLQARGRARVRPQHLHPHKQPPTNERVATYSWVTELSPVKAPLAIDVIKLLFKRLQARGRARLTTSAPSVPSNCIRTNNHPQTSESRRTVW